MENHSRPQPPIPERVLLDELESLIQVKKDLERVPKCKLKDALSLRVEAKLNGSEPSQVQSSPKRAPLVEPIVRREPVREPQFVVSGLDDDGMTHIGKYGFYYVVGICVAFAIAIAFLNS